MFVKHIKTPRVNHNAITCLFDNFDLIMANKELIRSNFSYRMIHVPGMCMGGEYIDMYDLSLGDMLYLWENTAWHNDSKFYYRLVGSPITGRNLARSYNVATRVHQQERYFDGYLGFMGLAEPALNYLKKIPDMPPSKLSIFDLVQQLQK